MKTDEIAVIPGFGENHAAVHQSRALPWPNGRFTVKPMNPDKRRSQFPLTPKRTSRNIITIAVVAVLIVAFVWLHPELIQSHYIRLQHERPEYYAELANACDSILANHRLRTNAVISIPVSDSSLPDAIKRLHPVKLQVSHQNVWMLLDSDSRAGIALLWCPKEEDTNVWRLYIVAENFETELYSVRR